MITRPTTKPGDVVEVQLGCCIAYLLVLRDTAFGVYANCYASRPPVAVITDAAVVEVVYVSGIKVETGEWPVIGHSEQMIGEDWWPPSVKYPIPSNPRQFMVVEKGHLRPATETDANVPLQVKLGELEFVDRLRRRCHCSERSAELAPQIRPSQIKPMEAAMSINKNDVAERVRIVFDEEMLKSKKAATALIATLKFFREDVEDEEFAVPFWLSLADIALTHGCLTTIVTRRAAEVIESGKHLLVAETWNPESERPGAEKLRRAVMAEFLERLNSVITT